MRSVGLGDKSGGRGQGKRGARGVKYDIVSYSLDI